MDYEDDCEATVAEHKKEICALIREITNDSTCLEEDAYRIEEAARFLDELRTQWSDDSRIRVTYEDGLNRFVAVRCEKSYKEKYNDWTMERGLSSREYFALIKLELGDITLSSAEAIQKATETTYKNILIALGKEQNV